MSQPPVGIIDIESYAPERFMTAAELSQSSGIPEAVITDKFGLLGKHIAREDEHVSDMCLSAARPLLERNDRSLIDAVVYFGSHWKDYLLWQVAPKIQNALRIEGFSLELINVSAGAPVALKVVGDMLRSDKDLRSILLVGASKESQLIDYTNQNSRFMFNFGDGAVAALVGRERAENQILGSSIRTDGSFSEHIAVFAGGSKSPTSIDTVQRNLHMLDLRDGEEMRRGLDPITLKNFVTVTREAVERSGFDVSDIDLLLPIHTKKSLFDRILVELGLNEQQAIYLDHHGHMSAVDPLLGLSLARDSGKVSDGDLVVLLAAGTGYTWAATALRWGAG